jgi:basic amino acid/polyamine antiporter, APA family
MSATDLGETQKPRHLLRVLGVVFGVAVTVGQTAGAGIFRAPGVVAEHLSTFGPFIGVWIAGALYALLGANALAELGTAVPRSGGPYNFVRRGLGNYPGFIVGWSDWLALCGATAVATMVIGEYVSGLAPELKGQTPVVAVATVLLFAALQWPGTRSGGLTQNAATLVKVAGLCILIAACFIVGNRGVAAASLQLDSGPPMIIDFIIALQAVIYTYEGWSAVLYFSEEIREPGRSIPRSMFGGLAMVAVVYIVLNLAMLKVVPIATIAGSDLAAAVVTGQMFGAHGDLYLRVLTILALLSVVSASLLMAPRVLVAMSHDGLVAERPGVVSSGGAPRPALFASSAMAILFIVSGRLEFVMAVLAFFLVAKYALSFLSLFALRIRAPEMPRPYRAWGHPFTTALALAGSVTFLAAAVMNDTRNAAVALALLAVSVPVYLVSRGLLGDPA